MPPLTEIFIAPVEAPLQLTLVLELEIEIADGWVNSTDVVAVHKFLSVTVTKYVPANWFVIVWLVCPPDHNYEYGEVPPFSKTLAFPEFPL